jgi:hypothetical protein
MIATARTSGRQWRFNDDTASPPRPLPESWAHNGDTEPLTDGQRRAFAIMYRVGRDYEWTVRDGQLIDGPHRDRSAVELLYVTADGEAAAARIVPATRTEAGVRPQLCTSLAAISSDRLSEAIRTRWPLYRALVGALYDGDGDPKEIADAWRSGDTPAVEEMTDRGGRR